MAMDHRRIAVVGVAVATAVAIPVAALASGSGSPATKGSAPVPTVPASKSAAADSQFPALAASAGISERRLEEGLVAAKLAGGNNRAGIAAFARTAGVSPATAQRIVTAVFGNQTGNALTGPGAAAVLAARLGIGTATARHALRQIVALSGRTGVDPGSGAFAAIARELGVSPARLAAALDEVKKSEAGR